MRALKLIPLQKVQVFLVNGYVAKFTFADNGEIHEVSVDSPLLNRLPAPIQTVLLAPERYPDWKRMVWEHFSKMDEARKRFTALRSWERALLFREFCSRCGEKAPCGKTHRPTK